MGSVKQLVGAAGILFQDFWGSCGSVKVTGTSGACPAVPQFPHRSDASLVSGENIKVVPTVLLFSLHPVPAPGTASLQPPDPSLTTAPPNLRSRNLGGLPVPLSPPPKMPPRHRGHCDPPCPRGSAGTAQPREGGQWDLEGKMCPVPGAFLVRVQGCHSDTGAVGTRWGPALAQEPSCDLINAQVRSKMKIVPKVGGKQEMAGKGDRDGGLRSWPLFLPFPLFIFSLVWEQDVCPWGPCHPAARRGPRGDGRPRVARAGALGCW